MNVLDKLNCVAVAHGQGVKTTYHREVVQGRIISGETPEVPAVEHHGNGVPLRVVGRNVPAMVEVLQVRDADDADVAGADEKARQLRGVGQVQRGLA